METKAKKTSERISIWNQMKKENGNPSFVMKRLYEYADVVKDLKAILPPKTELCKYVKSYCQWSKIGEQRSIKKVVKGTETIVTYTIRPSVWSAYNYFYGINKGTIEKPISK